MWKYIMLNKIIIFNLIFFGTINCSVMIKNRCMVGSRCSNPTEIKQLSKGTLYTIVVKDIKFTIRSNKFFNSKKLTIPEENNISEDIIASAISSSITSLGYSSIYIPLKDFNLSETNSNPRGINDKDQ